MARKVTPTDFHAFPDLPRAAQRTIIYEKLRHSWLDIPNLLTTNQLVRSLTVEVVCDMVQHVSDPIFEYQARRLNRGDNDDDGYENHDDYDDYDETNDSDDSDSWETDSYDSDGSWDTVHSDDEIWDTERPPTIVMVYRRWYEEERSIFMNMFHEACSPQGKDTVLSRIVHAGNHQLLRTILELNNDRMHKRVPWEQFQLVMEQPLDDSNSNRIQSLMNVAVRHDSSLLTAILMIKGGHPLLPDERGLKPFWVALESFHFDLMIDMLMYMTPNQRSDFFRTVNDQGQPLLHELVDQQRIDAFLFILPHAEDNELLIVDTHGRGLLQYALTDPKKVAFSQDLIRRLPPQSLTLVDFSGLTPLQVAIYYHQPKSIVESILKKIQITDTVLTSTIEELPLLHLANLAATKAFVKYLTPSQLSRQDNEGRTALMVALKSQEWDRALVLMKKADTEGLRVRDRYGLSALDILNEFSYVDVMKSQIARQLKNRLKK